MLALHPAPLLLPMAPSLKFSLILVYFPLCCIQASASLQTAAAAILNPKSSGLRFAATDRSIALPLFSRSLSTAPSALMLNSAALRMGGNERHCSVQQEGATKVYFRYNVSLVVPVMIGTPQQQVLMVADTGSELSWVQCLSASQGQQSDENSFNPFQSSSYAAIPCNSSACTTQTLDFPSPTNCGEKDECHFSYSYADATASEGTIARETISLGNGISMAGMVFGCVNSTFLTKSNADSTTGIMGLNRGALSFISQVQVNLYPKKFAYCIADPVQFPNSPGVLIFGESPYSNALSYTPLVKLSSPLPYFNNVAYSVRLKAIKVGEKLLPLAESVFMPDHTGAGQTMIDSGTQFTFLLGAAYSALKQEFAEQAQGRMHSLKEYRDFSFEGVLDLCYAQLPTIDPFPQLPAVTLMFDSAQLVLEGHRLLYPVPQNQSAGSGGNAEIIYCFTFGNSDLVPVEANIIGNHHQQSLWVEYDLDNSRIGFAPAACNMD